MGYEGIHCVLGMMLNASVVVCAWWPCLRFWVCGWECVGWNARANPCRKKVWIVCRACNSIYSYFNMFSLTYGASPAVYCYYYYYYYYYCWADMAHCFEFVLHFVRCDSFRTKLKSHFFIVDWFFRFSFMYFIILFSFFFAVRANVMLISWRVQMSELNWIEHGDCGWLCNHTRLFLLLLF